MGTPFEALVARCTRSGVTDLHLRPGRPAALRHDGRLRFQEDIVFDGAAIEALLARLTSERQRRELGQRLSLDFSAVVEGVPLRFSAFYSASGLGLAIRFLPTVPPRLGELNLHPSLRELAALPHGLILVCGPAGSGKSTTIAALLREIGETRPCHAVTLEDPIEYRFASDRALIDQRELGAHFQSFEQGLRDVLREDADVIMVGELREAETMRLTVGAAESGHLVIATLHAGRPEEAISRLLGAFGDTSQDFARAQVAACLGAVVVQRLERAGPESRRVPVLSIVRASAPVRNVIRENRLNQLEGMQQTGRGQGMFTFEGYREAFLENLAEQVYPGPAPRPPLPDGGNTPALGGIEPTSSVKEEAAPYRIGEEAPLAELVEAMRRTNG